jgi:His-Xaa-Ser system radical SAM maturase HxsC
LDLKPMLLKLSARGLRPLSDVSPFSFVGRICERPENPSTERDTEILLVKEPLAILPEGFRGYLLHYEVQSADRRDCYVLAPELRYLAHGDVVRVEPARRGLTALYRRASNSNTFLLTERCDNFCVMCSQPPRPDDDLWRVHELMNVIPLVSPDTTEIVFSGGEPALLGNHLVRLLETMKRVLPRTAVHVLSNGRRFSDALFARSLADVRHPDLMIGIPLYSDLPEDHDYVVQAKGAFDQTVRGILNLKRCGVRVELRFVIHRDTYVRLPAFAEFVARNLLFVDHVALMGLEMTGFAKTNADALWIDPVEYQPQLVEAARTLDRAGLNVSIYNHQLCVLSSFLHRFARKSISDWKNHYLEDCTPCHRKDECGGFFASSTVRRSAGIVAIS